MNAKQELLNMISGESRIKCAEIYRSLSYDQYDEDDIPIGFEAQLKLNYTEDEYKDFINKLDFDYNNFCDTEVLCGTIWLEDGVWISREFHDYALDISEKWVYNRAPMIPEHLIKRYINQ
jgi:hypothetical protein